MPYLVLCQHDDTSFLVHDDAVQRSALLAESARMLPPSGPLPVPHARRYIDAWAAQDLAAFSTISDLLQVCQVSSARSAW